MQTKPASAMRMESPDLAAAQLPQTVPECHAVIAQLLERVKLQLSLQEPAGGADKLSLTTPDRRFTIRTVACFGQCALAPVAEVNHAIRGHVKEQALMREGDKLKKEGAR